MKKFVQFSAAFLASVTLTLAPITSAQACTALLYMDAKGNAYKARTMEYDFRPPTSLTYMPAGTRIESKTPDGKQGITFDTKYPILGMTFPAELVPGNKNLMFVDAMNDQGLSISGNQQNNSKTPPMGTDPNKILAGNDFGSWLLGNFKTVAEAKAAILATDFWLPNIPFSGNVQLPLHYAIWDRAGNGIVLEFLNGKKVVYDNLVGAMTNGPEFSWHLTNLNNYTMGNVDQNVAQYGKLKAMTDDGGVALSALPSAQTAAGRFVRAAFYVNYVKKVETPDEAVVMLGHIINNFDRPTDLTVDKGPGMGDGPRGKGVASEVTEWTVMNDLSRNLFFSRSINAINFTMVDMSKLKDVKKMKSIGTYDLTKIGTDATSYFLN